MLHRDMATKTKTVPKRRGPKPTRSSDSQEEGQEQANTAPQIDINVEGLKYFAMLAPLLEHLHDDQCERDTAGNRTLHYDQYCMLVMLYVLNPTVSSLRALAQASELTKVQKKLGSAKASRGSLSEASGLFDADRLKPIIQTLASEVSATNTDPRLGKLADKLTAVDGSIVSAMPSLISASILKQTTGSSLVRWRLHTHFEVNTLIPRRVDLTPNGGGQHDERAVLNRVVEEDRLYIMDRGYAKYTLFNAIVSGGSSYACRMQDKSVYEVAQECPLTEGDEAAGVLSDQIVLFGQSGSKANRPDHPVRLVQIRCTAAPQSHGWKSQRFDSS